MRGDPFLKDTGLDVDFQNPELRVKPRAVGGTADLRITLTVNGDEVTSYPITTYGDLEDETGLRGIVFSLRELTDEEDLAEAEAWLEKHR